MKFLHLSSVIFFTFFGSSGLFAQSLDSVQRLNEVTVTGARFKHFNTGHFYTSLDSSTKTIQSTSYLGDVLTNSSLFQINSYGVGSVSVSARGMGEKRTPVIWNGFNIQSIVSTTADCGQLPSFFFEDVRAQMGGSSALFGSGAAAGVLFLNNKQKLQDGVGGQFVSHLGSFGNRYIGGEVSTTNGIYSGSVKVYYNQANNNFAYRARYSDQDIDTSQLNAQAKQYGLMMNNYFRITPSQTLNLNFWYTSNDKNIAPTLYSVVSKEIADGNQQDKFFAATTEYSKNFNNINLSVRSGLFNSTLDYEKPSWMQTSNSKATWWVNELESSVNMLTYLKVNGGVNFSLENASSSSFLIKEKRDREALFASVKYSRPDWRLSVSANGRGELVDGNGIPFTYSFGLEYTLLDYVTIKGNLAKNYRLPSFNDLFYKDAYSEGNPGLKPENGMNYEIGLELAQNNAYASMKIGTNLFLSRMDNWINWAARPDGVWSVFNIDKAEISGLESFIESNIRNDHSELTATIMYTYNDAKDKNTRKYIPNVPKSKFTYSFKYRLYKTSLTYQATQVGERFGNVTNTKTIAAYNISNVILSQNIKPGGLRTIFSVDLGVYNIFDKDYMVMDGYPMPKRNFRLGLRIIF